MVWLGVLRFPFDLIYLFAFKIGKFFSNGGRYEGEFKDGK